MEPVRHLNISEEEWRLLVDLEDGFNHRRYEPDGLRWAMDGLERAGLIEEVPNGYRVTELGRRVRAEMPAFGHGGPRAWTGLAELPALPAELSAEDDRSPPAFPI